MMVPDLFRRIMSRGRRLILPALVLVGSLLPGVAVADDLPAGVKNSQNPADISLSPQQSLKRITVPDGFHVTLFAGEPDLRRPIAFDFDDRGRLWVVENYAHPKWNKENATDRILVFEDTNHDGEFDQRTVFWDKGRYLTGIAVGHGGVWIANTPELSFIPDRDGNDIPDAEPIVMLDGFEVSSNNVLNNFHWGPDGWLYGAIGLNELSKVGKPGTPESARTRITRGMWRFHPVDHKFEKLASGMVNPWGADFNQYGDLITSNTVLAHLWHIVPGMICERRAAERENPYGYERIQSITNHLHWGGGAWTNSRNTADHHSVAGGGHAHCGAMIYLGDNWPKKYWGTFFTNNLHGNRVNNDLLVPKRSSYVGVHSEDLLFGNDPWFRGLSIRYGPDGGVYISDWHDLGECHDSDGGHRSSGRIYKVVYGKPEKRTFNLQQQTDAELARLHLHPNEWFVRHARRILQERAVAGIDVTAARKQLRAIFASDKDELNKLRALWTLYVLDDLEPAELVGWLDHESQHVRRWAVRFLVDRGQPGEQAIAAMARLAAGEESAKVRLALAVALQRIDLENRWAIAEALVTYAQDAVDPYLPLMIWYGVEPLVQVDRARALELAVASHLPRVRRFIARRALDAQQPVMEDVIQAALGVKAQQARLDFLQGMLDVLTQRGQQPAPSSWPALYRLAAASGDATTRSVAVRLATIFGDKQAIGQLQKTVLGVTAPVEQRREALGALLKLEQAVSASMLHSLTIQLTIQKSQLRRDVIQGLVLHNNNETPEVLLDCYSRLSTLERQDA
ncbi:MAG: PVC-type heme-binding CxxCH protein, partial [Pirellulaceae bacterium]